jgi:hypothetical protein
VVTRILAVRLPGLSRGGCREILFMVGGSTLIVINLTERGAL